MDIHLEAAGLLEYHQHVISLPKTAYGGLAAS